MTNEEAIKKAAVYAEYVGGLGDAILRMYFSARAWYGALEELSGKEQAVVSLMSHNKNLAEIFQWHPNKSRIRVIDLGFTTPFHPWENAPWRKANGLPAEAPCPPYAPADTLRFYPPEQDLRFIDRMAGDKKKFMVMAATASTDERTIPESIRHEIASQLGEKGFNLVVVGRSRYFHGKRLYDVPLGIGSTFDMVDKLTVPGTIELIKKSSGVITAHSSMLHAAWHEQKPVFLLYNQWMKETLLPHGAVGYMQGINRPDTDHMEFSAYKKERLHDWLLERL